MSMDLPLGPAANTRTSFSSSDVTLYLQFPYESRETNEVADQPIYLLDTASGISINSYMDKAAVRPLGYRKPVSITKGTQTIAGSFSTIMNGSNPLQELKLLEVRGDSIGKLGVRAAALPPFTLMIIGVNEYGAAMASMVHGVEITTLAFSSQLMDGLIEEQYEFIAEDWTPLSQEAKGALNNRVNEFARIDEAFREERLKLSYAHQHVARSE